LRFSVLAAEAETAMAQAERTVSRRIVFRTGAPPMHSIEAMRKRFFTIFFIKRNACGRRPCLSQQVAIRAIVENTSEEGNYLDADSLD
jgi:hypothetical protein